MKDFKFLDDKSDIQGMEHFTQYINFNGTHFKLEFYTDLSPTNLFDIRMHMFATLRTENMESEEGENKFKSMMEEFFHRVNIRRLSQEDIIQEERHDSGIEELLNGVEPEERGFIDEMRNAAATFLFDDAFINRKIFRSRYGRVRYLDHIRPERNENTWEQSFMVLATKRELDTLSHNTNNIWITVIRYDNREGKWFLHDRTIINGEGLRLNNVPYEITV